MCPKGFPRLAWLVGHFCLLAKFAFLASGKFHLAQTFPVETLACGFLGSAVLLG
jgi:hypothetical protein